MKNIIKATIISTIIIVAWVLIATFPKLLFPLFFLLPIIKVYLILGLANGFMGDKAYDNRQNNRFHFNSDFIGGAVATKTIMDNKERRK